MSELKDVFNTVLAEGDAVTYIESPSFGSRRLAKAFVAGTATPTGLIHLHVEFNDGSVSKKKTPVKSRYIVKA